MLIFLTKAIDKFKNLTYNILVVKNCNIKEGEMMLNIKELRRKQGLTQRELASKLGVDRSRISQWEIGYCLPRVTELPKLAEALNCNLQDFFKKMC